MENRFRSLLYLYGIMAMISDLEYPNKQKHKYIELTDEHKREIKIIAEQKRKEHLKKRGINEYFYGKNVVYARNKKNADRKACNKGYLDIKNKN